MYVCIYVDRAVRGTCCPGVPSDRLGRFLTRACKKQRGLRSALRRLLFYFGVSVSKFAMSLKPCLTIALAALILVLNCMPSRCEGFAQAQLLMLTMLFIRLLYL